MNAENPSTTASPLPPGLSNAFIFATFNALSFQIILGSPMVLYAKTLEASATVLGIIAGMMPLLVIFQIPAASHIGRIGYRRFVLAGWGTRVAFIFAMASVPLTGSFLGAPSQLGLLLFLLFGFNLSRGISSAAWLPWITSLVPLDVRGRYLARDALCVHMASCLTFLLAALVLRGTAMPWQFAALFGFSAITGAASLTFLRRIPDVAVPQTDAGGKGPVPWRTIAAFPPFRKLLVMNMAWSLAYGGLGAFTVAYLKEAASMSEALIMLVSGLAFLGGLTGLLFFESRTDRLGSKPVLAFALAVWLIIAAGWTLLATRAFNPGLFFVVALELLMGFAYALVSINNTRLAMLTVPTLGRTHFFALYSVLTNLTLGLAPVAWGLLLDSIGTRTRTWQALEINRYSCFFAAVFCLFLLALALSRRLDEPRAMDIDALIRDLLRSPQRLWLRIWPRG